MRSACAWYTGSGGGSCRVSVTTRTGSLSCWGATQSPVEGCLSCPVPQQGGLLCPLLCCAWHVGVAQGLQESSIGPRCLQLLKWMALSDTYPLSLTASICLQVLGELCFQGYMDAVRFLEENGAYGPASTGAPLVSFAVAAVATPRWALPVVSSPLVSLLREGILAPLYR